jgi:hypothetical protein
MKVEGEGFSDRLLVAFGASSTSTLLRSSQGEEFRFAGYGLVRAAGKEVVARGKFEGFRIHVGDRQDLSLTVNGKKETASVRGRFLIYGNVPREAAAEGASAPSQVAAETRAAIHAYFLPEEVHLKAGGEREVAVTLRAVARGEAGGALRLLAPEGISVEPGTLELVPPLAEGAERTVKLRVRARSGMPAGLAELRLEPVGDTAARAESVPLSVGVVLRKDRRLPRLAQWVARAPGYTVKVDEFSGIASYLLDADGHRRFGRINSLTFCYGFGAVELGGDWIFRAQRPCHQVWSARDSLTILGDPSRLQYVFQEDRILIKFIPPTPADREHKVWLANFDALETPVHDGTQRVSHEPIVAKWLFFPHPVCRRGVLLRLPKPTPVSLLSSAMGPLTAVNFPMRMGDEVSLTFTTREELPR